MPRIIPLFPLQIVVYPGEILPLHIFEDRYKQLLADCTRNNMNFGIPAYMSGALKYGTEMELQKVAKKYESGVMDIVCVGVRVFQIEKFFNPLPKKLYAGGEVSFIKNVMDGTDKERKEIINLIHKLYKTIGVAVKYIEENTFNSYSYAHKIGMSTEDEYKLLEIAREKDRLCFIKNHLIRVLPILKQMNETRERIQMNGHFRNLDPLKF